MQNQTSIQKIKNIKQRDTKPFSIIVPNTTWIYENCIINLNSKTWINKLSGHYTFILKQKNSNKTIGIRIPNNWFSKFISEINICFITTSVNLTSEKHITKIEDLKDEIKIKVDYFIDDGKLKGKPSTIIDLTEEKETIIRN